MVSSQGFQEFESFECSFARRLAATSDEKGEESKLGEQAWRASLESKLGEQAWRASFICMSSFTWIDDLKKSVVNHRYPELMSMSDK